MIGALLFLNTRGDVVLSRPFRDGLPNVRTLAETFKHSIIATKKTDQTPVNILGRVAYFHMRFEDLFVVVCSNSPNANAMAIYQYMIRLIQLLTNFFSGETVTEESLKEHFVLVQEIIDETCDFGFPQLTELDALREYIKTGGEDGEGGGVGGKGGLKQEILSKARAASLVTAKVTGAIPWRKEGIVYRENEAFMDVMEEINLLMSHTGEVLQRDVTGVVRFKSFLTGMPECKLVLNDVEQMNGKGGDDFASIMGLNTDGGGNPPSASSTSANPTTSANPASTSDVLAAAAQASAAVAANAEARQNKGKQGVRLDDVAFHPCVRLSVFGTNRTISFVPPDGDFTLMTYRTSRLVTPPISILYPRVEEVSKTRMNIDFRLKSDFPKGVEAKDVNIKIPCPHNTANVAVRVKSGKAKYVPTEQAIVWKIKSLEAFEELAFSVEISLIAATVCPEVAPNTTTATIAAGLSAPTGSSAAATQLRTWARPPITVNFNAHYAASGIKAQQLTVNEPKLGYKAKSWVRYNTSGGEYECRLGDVIKGGGGGGPSATVAPLAVPPE